MMKIAMIGQRGIPSRAGGVEVHVEEIAKRLVNLGCEVDVFCRKGYCKSTDKDVYEGVHIKYAPFIKSKSLETLSHTFFASIKALFTHYDIYHYHALGPSSLAFIPKILGKKVVCTVHGLDWQRGKWGTIASKYLKLGELATARFSDATINVSQNLVSYYWQKYNKETAYIPNGVVKPILRPPEIIHAKYGLGKNDYILFLARLVPEKGAHYLIEAYRQLDTDKKLVIAGGSCHSDDYVRELVRLAQGDKRIIFTGFVEGVELEELFSNAYLYTLPSDIEGLPISLLEAMSYGNCCLTSDIPENAFVIDKLGFTFFRSNPEDLKGKLKMLINHQEEVSAIRETVQDFVLSRYNWECITQSTLDVYKSILGCSVS